MCSRRLPLRLNVNINGPFRALIQMAKAFKDPTQVIAPVMPFPIDSPALKVEVLEHDQERAADARLAAASTHHHPTNWRTEVTRAWTTAARLASGMRRRRCR